MKDNGNAFVLTNEIVVAPQLHILYNLLRLNQNLVHKANTLSWVCQPIMLKITTDRFPIADEMFTVARNPTVHENYDCGNGISAVHVDGRA